MIDAAVSKPQLVYPGGDLQSKLGVHYNGFPMHIDK